MHVAQRVEPECRYAGTPAERVEGIRNVVRAQRPTVLHREDVTAVLASLELA